MDDQTIAELTSLRRRASFERFANADVGKSQESRHSQRAL